MYRGFFDRFETSPPPFQRLDDANNQCWSRRSLVSTRLLRDTVLVIPYSSETETNIYRRGCEKGIPVTPVRLGIRINGRWYFIGSFSKLSQPVRGDNDLWRRNKWRRPLFLRESYKSERRTRQVLWAWSLYVEVSWPRNFRERGFEGGRGGDVDID